ncbi:methyl-accepting chemotaxis sensory transducer [Denitrovibrio acetiphilus DSM 12809]|uniref:Methyl-accepting chemotaxis sensory transducer n=1 Tax=Denitrovibrio acetiphilus (strain DSM 12809 / NBRC 114555 / N2460) TaxID=522772 RepID=D4H0N0_DENA2|nr:methyl-accepting chemotaxis protein [Denitrovibrio acetiphilus]ADD68543.1 methyl-accepting chemotaxis sensory transducer [Denitrovibrio acetiphilus DSM 12809]
MNIKVKLIMSYLLVTCFIIVLSLTFMISSKRVTGYVNVVMNDMLADREVANTVNSEFKNIVIAIKSARVTTDLKEIDSFQKSIQSNFTKIDKALSRKPNDENFRKVSEKSEHLKVLAESFLKQKSEYIKTNDDMLILFDDMDSLFRKQKGYIFVSMMALEKFGDKYKNTLNFLHKMMEDPLEIKVYISEIVNAKDAIDAEDGVFTLVNYAKKLTEKAQTILDGGSYKGDYIVAMKNDEVRERMTMLLGVTKTMIDSSARLQNIRLQTIDMEKNLVKQINVLEKDVVETEAELKSLTKTAKEHMDNGVKTIYSISAKVMTSTIIMLVVVLVLAVIIGIYSASQITKPLRKIMNVAENIKNGNLMCGDVKHESNDEFGALTNSINTMQQSLCDLVVNVTTSTNYLSQTSDQSAELMHKMHENLNDTNLEMAAAASAAEELSSSTVRIIESVQIGIKEVQTAKEKVVEGNLGLQTSISQVSSVASNLAGVADSLAELKTASQGITNIVSIIVDIAEQTNLLALNAAIEAARAGEAGRGFAVVADEVRKLAEKTGTSTQEISSMVGSIQSNVQGVVDIVHTGIDEVESSSKSITEVGENFEEVVRQMESAAKSVEPILNIIEQQSEAIANITTTVTNVSISSEDNKKIVDEVSQFSEKLAELSHELQEQISHFKTNQC